MKKLIYTVAAAALLASAGSPAHADASVREGKVGLSVKGTGLTVSRAGGSMDGHAADVRGRLYAVRPDGSRYAVTGWKAATPVSAGLTRLSSVDWKLNRTFRQNTRLCIQFTRASGTPCARIHR
ncbi:hypothetical protein [Streptomyces sp. NPDC059142]|uniref:hypothetical protein n=1 Tax=Streptomyces sp. NPDC059142 TaxID=3346739 RepID=UPI0036973D83